MNPERPDASSPRDGTAVDRAFELIADGTRLSILRVLWEVSDPLDPKPVRFTDLRDLVGVDDPGRLNYHLGKLMTHFIRRSADGYELREAGKRIMRVVVSGTAVDGVTIEPTEIEATCTFCGGPTGIEYDDGILSHRCFRCSSRCIADYPASILSRDQLPPAGLSSRTPDEIFRANQIWMKHRESSVMDGVCPECSGPIPVVSVRCCDAHDPDPQQDTVCDSCGSIFWGVVYLVCRVCKFRIQLPTCLYPPTHPTVISFYDDHGIEFDLGWHEHRAYLLQYDEAVISEDPLRIQTTIRLDEEELTLELDDQMQVGTVRRRSIG